ncbi:helix-turn-helix transcriptional regulator [Halostella salina]|uniref:helix-turn-helix transcriptional regulator n=1 Tax=Halostella salina TaxID=1547897 RepID=UPI000EF7E3EA|nr:hypothetical protein [Halostella salina]
MRLRAAVSFALLVSLVLAPVGAAAAMPLGTDPGRPPAAAQQTADPPDPETVFRVRITESGHANWTVEFRQHLETENDTEAFRDYRDEIVAGEERPPVTESTFQQFADEASAATGRNMTIRNGRYTGRVANDTGIIAFHFTWTNFASVNGDDRIAVGDAFNGTSGTWFPQLDDGQRLVIEPPDGHIPSTAPRGHENGTFEWNGPYEFNRNEITIVYTPSGSDGNGTNGGGGETTGPGGDADEPIPMALLGVGVVALVVAVGTGGYLLARRQNGGSGGVVADTAPATETGAVTEPDAGADADGDAADADEDEPADDDTIDETLLSDEERVTRLLEENGGRMKQAKIVSETGWSNAKVSQLLSSMDDDDRIDKLRIGRENLITLPDEDIGDID